MKKLFSPPAVSYYHMVSDHLSRLEHCLKMLIDTELPVEDADRTAEEVRDQVHRSLDLKDGSCFIHVDQGG